MASKFHKIWCYGERPYRSWTRRSCKLTFIVHGHTENSLLYHPLFDKLVEYWQVVPPSTWAVYTKWLSIGEFLLFEMWYMHLVNSEEVFQNYTGQPGQCKNMRIKNDLEFQIARYQSRVTCFDIILTEALAEVWMSKHVARDWYLPIWNERSFLILFLAKYWQ